MEIGIYPNLKKKTIIPFFRSMQEIMKHRGIRFYVPEEVIPAFAKEGIDIDEDCCRSDAWIGTHVKHIFSIGGDGSFLQAAKRMAEYPVILTGINLGELGFLNEISPPDLEKRLDQIEAGDYATEERVFLSGCIQEENGNKISLSDALNDIVVGHSKPGKMARVQLWVNDEYTQEYPSDGIIISTATGSTSYALSCGGPILNSTAEQMLVVPICAHLMRNIPLLIDGSSQIRIAMPERESALHVSVDGNKSYKFTNRSCLLIRTSHKKIRFLRFSDQSFFKSLYLRLLRRDQY